MSVTMPACLCPCLSCLCVSPHLKQQKEGNNERQTIELNTQSIIISCIAIATDIDRATAYRFWVGKLI